MASGTASSGGSTSDINMVRQRASSLDFSRHAPVELFLNSLADRLEGANARVQKQCLSLMKSVVVASEWMIDPDTVPKNIAPAHIANATESVKKLDTFLATPSSPDDELPQLVCDVYSSVNEALAAGAANSALDKKADPATLAAAPETPVKDVKGADTKSAPPKR